MDKGSAKPATIMFLAGIVTGGVIATLYAPKSGKETRSDIKHKAGRAQNDIKNKRDEMRDKFKRGVQEARTPAHEQTTQPHNNDKNDE